MLELLVMVIVIGLAVPLVGILYMFYDMFLGSNK